MKILNYSMFCKQLKRGKSKLTNQDIYYILIKEYKQNIVYYCEFDICDLSYANILLSYKEYKSKMERRIKQHEK